MPGNSLRAMGLCLTVALLPSGVALGHDGAPAANPEKMWAGMLAKQQSLAVSAAFDGHGRLWRVDIADRRVRVDFSDDLGKTFSAPVAVNPEPEAIGADGDSRPKIAVAKDGAIYVSYTQMLEKPFSGDVRFSRSLDGGKTFSSPVTINDNHDIIGHRFDALAVSAEGWVYLAWLDKRDGTAAKKKGDDYSGSAVYYTVSKDRGASFAANIKLADHSCDCCRVALAPAPEGAPVALWRHVYDGNVRDHALAKLDGSAPRRVTYDQWQVEACPHHGPALSINAGNVYHLAWFNNAPQAHGLFYARSPDGGKTYTLPLAFGDAAAQAGHADILSLGREVYIAWKEFDGESSVIQVMHSGDGGTLWSPPRKFASTSDASDHPQLVNFNGRLFLSWNTLREGYRLIEVGDEKQELRSFMHGSRQAIVAAHQGRPFVLALWSLDCVHCRDDLTLLGKLQTRYPVLDVVLVAADDPSRRDEILATLKHYRLIGAASWVFADSFVERLRYEIDPRWYGELPRTYFYDAAGKATAISGRLEEARVGRWIAEGLRHD